MSKNHQKIPKLVDWGSCNTLDTHSAAIQNHVAPGLQATLVPAASAARTVPEGVDLKPCSAYMSSVTLSHGH